MLLNLHSSMNTYTKPAPLLTVPDYNVIVFTRPHVNAKAAFSKTSTLESVFENLRFHSPKTPFTCGRNAKTEEKTSVFKNIRIRVDGASYDNQSEALVTVHSITILESSLCSRRISIHDNDDFFIANQNSLFANFKPLTL